MADSYSLSMRATVLCWSYEGPLIILVAINAPLYNIKYCHDTGQPFRGAWLKDREGTANFSVLEST